MTVLNEQQIAQLLYNAGFRGTPLLDMTAIAMRESGGQWNRVNDNAATGDLSYGLWQINMIGQAGPQRLAQFGLGSTNDLLDPAQQARAAFILSSNGTDLSPWGGYKGVSNTFGTDMGAAQQAVAAAQANGWQVQVPSGKAAGWQTNSGNPAPIITPGGQTGTSASLSGGGGQVPGNAAAGTIPTQPKLDEAELAAQYGFSSAFFNSDPSLRNLINQAVANQWSDAEFTARLQATPWFQQHSDAERKWIAQWKADPATGHMQLQQGTDQILLWGRQMGVTVTPGMARNMADKMLRFGLSADLVKQGIATEFSLNPGNAGVGQAADLENQYKNIAASYGVNLSPNTLTYWIRNGLQGAGGSGAFTEAMKVMAKGAFPGLSQQIDQGMTVQQVADPYKQSMSNLLEIAPSAITLQDPTLRKALAAPADKPGQPPALMPIWQFEQQLRSDPRWASTDNARNAAVGVATQIGKDWGVYAA